MLNLNLKVHRQDDVSYRYFYKVDNDTIISASDEDRQVALKSIIDNICAYRDDEFDEDKLLSVDNIKDLNVSLGFYIYVSDRVKDDCDSRLRASALADVEDDAVYGFGETVREACYNLIDSYYDEIDE